MKKLLVTFLISFLVIECVFPQNVQENPFTLNESNQALIGTWKFVKRLARIIHRAA